MDSQGTFVAAMIDTTSKAIAGAAALEVMERVGEGEVPGSFDQLRADLEMKLLQLSETLAVGLPDMFAHEVAWARETYAARGISPTFLPHCLAGLRSALEERLTPDSFQMAAALLERTQAQLQGDAKAPRDLLAGLRHTELARGFLEEALHGNAATSIQMLEQAREDGLTVDQLREEVIAPVQAEIGRMWQCGEINVAEEHHCSRVVQEMLARLRERPQAQVGRSLLAFSVAGDLHEIGSRLVADQFEAAGWHVIFLGANVPPEDSTRMAADKKVDLATLSVSQSIHMRAAARQIAALHALDPPVPVLVGGLPFTAIDGLWQAVGADGCATSATAALHEANRLLAG